MGRQSQSRIHSKGKNYNQSRTPERKEVTVQSEATARGGYRRARTHSKERGRIWSRTPSKERGHSRSRTPSKERDHSRIQNPQQGEILQRSRTPRREITDSLEDLQQGEICKPRPSSKERSQTVSNLQQGRITANLGPPAGEILTKLEPPEKRDHRADHRPPARRDP